MKYQMIKTIIFLSASLVCAAPPATTLCDHPRAGANTPDLNYPEGCMTSYSRIPFGWLPDYNGPNMHIINADSGKQACMYGYYMQFDSSYNDSQLTFPARMSDIIASGAVFVPAIMPTGLDFSQIDSKIAAQIASTVSKFTSKGVMVFLRFAHEMNYYSSVGTYHGSSSDFVAAWRRVHAAIASNPRCKMFWSPNRAKSSDLQQWWPGTNYVDIVGMDAYPEPGSSFSSVYSDFYHAFSAKYNKHFVLGETGSGVYDVANKEAWLKQITQSDFSKFPNYQGASWFEYYKDNDDFRVLIGQSPRTIQTTLSNFR